jgi:hypothetical protein
MKIVFFNDQRVVTSVLENVSNPVAYGLSEVRWDDGGYSFLNDNYLILDDTIDFTTVSEDEFLSQYKEQAKYDLAKVLDANRVSYMVAGTLTEKENQFTADKTTIDSKTSIEDVKLFMIEIENR